MQYRRPQPAPPPPPPVIPERERRRHPRKTLENVRVRVVNGAFDELGGSVNLAKRLVNVSQGGICVETTGRLRPDVKLNVEVRFDEIRGALRAETQVVWVNTVNPGAAEAHLLGLKFVNPEISSTVREYLEGGRASMIMTRRQAEYEELKAKSTARKVATGAKPWSASKRIVAFALVLLFLYVGSFGAIVQAGRSGSPGDGLRFRYPAAQETMSKVYSPLVWALRKAGVDLAEENPVTSK